MTTTLDQAIVSETILAPLQVKTIHKYLCEQSINSIGKIHVFPSIESTNKYLLGYEASAKQVVICLAEHQTQGRGRYGHQWESPSGVNVYLSMSWPLHDTQKKYDVLSLWLLLAIAELLEKHQLQNIQLKWPNDICVQGKKLAGVLIERKIGQSKHNLVIGLGLNVAMSLKDDVRINTPWIDLLSIKPNWQVSRNELSAQLIEILMNTLTHFEQEKLNDLAVRWNDYDMLKNEQVQFLYDGEIGVGEVKGIDESGQIILNMNGEVMHLHSSQLSEIKLIGKPE